MQFVHIGLFFIMAELLLIAVILDDIREAVKHK